MSENHTGWERSVLEKLALAAVDEQRRARRWGIFFKFLIFGYLFVVLAIAMGWFSKKDGGAGAGGKHTALVEVNGVIAPGSAASADLVMQGLAEAFKDKRTQGILRRRCMPWWRTCALPAVITSRWRRTRFMSTRRA
jgi:protease-4